MNIITSLSPGHSNKDNQQIAVESWQRFGNCYSMNLEDEITEPYTGIKFIETTKTTQFYTGKKLVSINAMIDFAKEDLLLINSDIVLTSLPELKQDGITIFSRNDYVSDINEATIFKNGFDAFYIPEKFLTIFPPSVYSMGAAWWDYWIPYTAIYEGISVYSPTTKHAFHKIHPTQYSFEEWNLMGDFFRWQFKFNKRMTIPDIASLALRTIKSKLL